MILRIDCASCDAESMKLDGATASGVSGWFELTTVDDLFGLAAGDRFDLTEFTADGIVGLPLVIGLSDSDSGETVRLLTTWFTSEIGTLDVEHDESGEIWIAPRGFDEWWDY